MKIKIIDKNGEKILENNYYVSPQKVTRARDYLYLVGFYSVFGGIFLSSVVYLTRNPIWGIVIAFILVVLLLLFKLIIYIGTVNVVPLASSIVKFNFYNYKVSIYNDIEIFSSTLFKAQIFYAKDELEYLYTDLSIEEKNLPENIDKKEKVTEEQNYFIAIVDSNENKEIFSIDEENFKILKKSFDENKIDFIEKNISDKMFKVY